MPIDKILAIRNACPADIGGDLDMSAARFLMAKPAAAYQPPHYAAAAAPISGRTVAASQPRISYAKRRFGT